MNVLYQSWKDTIWWVPGGKKSDKYLLKTDKAASAPARNRRPRFPPNTLPPPLSHPPRQLIANETGFCSGIFASSKPRGAADRATSPKPVQNKRTLNAEDIVTRYALPYFSDKICSQTKGILLGTITSHTTILGPKSIISSITFMKA